MSQPEQVAFATAREALRALEQSTLLNQVAWDCKARLSRALDTVDHVIQATESDKQAALHAVQMFAEIPGALGVGECTALATDAAATGAAVTALECDVAEIVAAMGGLP